MLAFAIQCWGTSVGKGDVRSAIELCQLISDIEEKPRSDCYFMGIFRKDTPSDQQNRCIQALRDKFNADGFIARNYGTGHPYGANQLWISAMAEIEGRLKEHDKMPKGRGKFPYNGVLTFEPDCVPLRKDWIKALTMEWEEKVISAGYWEEDEADPDDGKMIGRPKYEFMGHWDTDHFNGNMVLRPDMLTRVQVPYTTNLGWDYYNKDRLKKFGYDTNLILQHYRRGKISKEEIPFLIKNDTVPALFHGVQDQVGVMARKLIRERLVDGVTA